MIAVSCGCGKNFKAKPEYAGRRVVCPQCNDPLRVPMAKKKRKSTGSKSKRKSRKAMDSLLDEVGINKAGSAGSCPSCKEQLTPDAVLCINCGYHLDGGKQLGTKSLIRQSKGVGKAHLGSEIRSDLPASLIKFVSQAKMAGLVMSLVAATGISLLVAMATMPDVKQQILSVASFLNMGLLGGVGMISLVAGLLSFAASKKAKRGERAARSLGFMSSLMMLLVVPVGTLLGLMMLISLIHPDTKRFYR